MSQTLTITAEQVLASAERIREDIVRDRRTLHAAPEVGTDLPNTVACVKKRLLEMGYQPRELAGGVVAEITGTETGRCLLLRADMDALRVTEQTGLDFASANGCMHACGHDMHAAMLLGAAKLLREYQGELNGTVKLVFQPDEEGFTGAKAMLSAGVLKDPAPQAGFALHVNSGTPSGLVRHVYGGLHAVPHYGKRRWMPRRNAGKGRGPAQYRKPHLPVAAGDHQPRDRRKNACCRDHRPHDRR